MSAIAPGDAGAAPRASRALRWLRLGALITLAAAAGGCALLPDRTPPAAATASASSAASAPGAPAVAVDVVAPPELKALLDRHLDLRRLAGFTRDDTVDATEWSRLIDATPAQVRDLLQTEGYFAPQVRIVREPADAALPRSLRVEVDPGPRTSVSRLTLEFEGDLERAASAGDGGAEALVDTLRRAWRLPAGAPFRNADWSDAKAAVLAQLRASGYPTAAWSGTAADVDVEARLARLFLVVDSGPQFRFGQLRIEGLQRHDPETVQNLAGIAPGTPVTEALLLDYQERLQKAGLFESVAVTLDIDPARAAASDVVVRLREAPLQVWTVGVGVSANTGPRTSVEHVHRRLFGWAATAHNKAEYGRLRQAWEGELSTHPGEKQRRWLLGGAVERLEGDDDIVLSQRLRLGRAQETQRVERLAFVEVERSSRRPLPVPRTVFEESSAIAVSGNFHGIWRRIDSVILPTEGWTLALQGGVGRSHGSDSPSGPFTRAYGRLTIYEPLGSRWYGQARLEAGQVFRRNAVAVPDSQRFRAGGDESVRGYGYRSLGPLDNGVVGSGDVLLTGSVELATPISTALPSLWGAVFVDAGNAANSFGNLDPLTGVGVGVRWRSPVGPLRLDWAWAPALSQGRLHFSVGIAF